MANPTVTTLYLWGNNAAPSDLTKPAGAIGTYSQTNTNRFGTNAKLMTVVSDQSQQTLTNSDSSFGTGLTATLASTQYLSPPLLGQGAVSAANWTVALAMQLSNAGVNAVWGGQASL